MPEEEPKFCSVDDCDRSAVTRGWCHAHYLRWRRTGTTNGKRKLGARRNTVCEVDGCERLATTRGMCRAHYGRFKRTGRVDADRPIGAKSLPQQCAVRSCSALASERGWCHGHYLRWVRLGDVQEDRPLSRQVNSMCDVDGCTRLAVARGMCPAHASRKRKWGDVRADQPIREVAGGGYVHHGYRVVPVPRKLRHLTNGESPYLEHRLVMAQVLGRPLTDNESVHHKDGNRLNNDPSNLELWSRWQPSGQRVADKIAYAIELLERYLPSALAAQLPLILAPPSPDEI